MNVDVYKAVVLLAFLSGALKRNNLGIPQEYLRNTSGHFIELTFLNKR